MAIDQTRDKILTVANELFSRFGFRKTSMDEIAKISRKAKGSLYYHFANKEDLFREVVSIEITKIEAILSVIIKDQELTAADKFKKYIITRMEMLNEAANYHDTLKADFMEHYDFIDDLRKDHTDWEKKSLKSVLLQGINSGEFDVSMDLDILTEVLMMMLKSLEILFFIQDRYNDHNPHFENLIGMFIKGLKA